MKKIYSIINSLVVLAVIIWNYVINTVGIDGKTISDLSDQYSNYFTPASYAFSIWGCIFVGLLVLSVFQFYRTFVLKSDDKFVLTIGPWLLVTNLANGLWSYLFINELTAWSIVALCTMVISLVIIIVKLNMQRYDADFPVIAFLWWPISLYAGWVVVAFIANIAAYLSKVGFDTIFLSNYQFAIVMVVLTIVINVLMVRYRNMRLFGLVGVWSLVAIGVQQWGEQPVIVWHALAGALIILVFIFLSARKNKDTHPLTKYKQWKQNPLS